MREQNFQMKMKIKQYEDELEIVKWYIQVLEDGIDTRQIVKEYYQLKKEHSVLQETTEKQIKKLQK